jgi:fibronectin type 3 domain-containing protein
MMKQISMAAVFLALLLGLAACASTGGPKTATDTVADVPAAGATEAAPEKPSKPTTGELKNTLKWTTASEVDNFGFDVYRSTTEDGPFERMTEEPLAGAGTIDEPQDYVFEDATIEPGVDYYYYIESISLSGVRERFSPVIKSPAKY